MKIDKHAFFGGLENVINEAVGLGMARQRHMDAARDERAAAKDVGEYVKELLETVGLDDEPGPTIQ